MIFISAVSEITLIRNIPANAREGLEDAINQAEEIDLRQFLSPAFYKDFVDNKTDAKYTDLLNGATYTCGTETIDFPGIKKAILYFALGRWYVERSTSPTRSGLRVRENDVSAPPSSGMLNQKVEQERSAAYYYLKEAEKFLNANSDTYPLWYGTDNKVNKFQISAIG